VSSYSEEEFSDTELSKKLHLFSSAGDILIDKEKYDKVMAVYTNCLPLCEK
jgi:hypothetical protein